MIPRLLIVALLALPLPFLGAQQTVQPLNGLQVSLTCGFESHALGTQAPLPCVLMVTNTTDDTLACRLVLHTGVEDLNARELEFTVPPGRRRYAFTLDPEDGTAVYARLYHRRRLVWRGNARPSDLSPWTVPIGLVTKRYDATLGGGSSLDLPGLRYAMGGGHNPRDLRVLRITPPYLPDEAAALSGLPVIVFAPDLVPGELGPSQIQCLGNYLAAGGVIVLHRENGRLLNQLRQASPLPPAYERPVDLGPGLSGQHLGQGMLLLSRVELVQRHEAARQTLQPLVLEAAYRDYQTFPKYLRHSRWRSPELGQRSSSSLLFVLIFFVLYGLCSGPLLLIFARKKQGQRQRLKTVVAVIIGAFVLGAIGLGIFLRNYRGELHWCTVTELSPDGGVQEALLTARSAGGSRHELSLGDVPEAWLLGSRYQDTNRYRYYGYGNYETAIGFDDLAPFAEPPPETGDFEVPLAPWGRRLLLARTFLPGYRVDGFEPRLSWPARGTLNVRLANTSSETWKNCQIVLASVAYVNQSQAMPTYEQLHLGDVRPGKTVQRNFSPTFTGWRQNVQVSSDYLPDEQPGQGSMGLPQIHQYPAFYGWLIAQIEQSPGLAMQDGDFEPSPGLHYIVLPLNREDLRGLASVVPPIPPTEM